MALFSGPDTESGNAAEILSAVDPACLHDAVIEAVRAGWMLSLSSSRDGYSVRVAVLHDGDKDAAWCEDVKSCERALYALTAAAKGGTGQGRQTVTSEAEKAPRKRKG